MVREKKELPSGSGSLIPGIAPYHDGDVDMVEYFMFVSQFVFSIHPVSGDNLRIFFLIFVIFDSFKY